MSQDDLFGKIQQQTNIDPSQIYKIANSVQHADFSDEKTVRQLVRQLARLANRRISKEKEDQIVRSIVNNNMPMDMQSLSNIFKK